MLSLLQQLAAPPKYLARVALRSAGKISFVNIEDILYVQAAENYVQLHLKAARHLLHVPIATFEGSLDPQMFLRIHRSLIVNVKHIQELETGAARRVHRGAEWRGAAAVEPELPRKDQALGVESVLRASGRQRVRQRRAVFAAVAVHAIAARLGITKSAGLSSCPERQGREAIRVGPLVLRHARQRGFADADLACHLAPRGRPRCALGVDRW